MQGFKRRVVYATLYELLAIAFTTFGLTFIVGHGGVESAAVSVMASVIAFIWNFIFNALFERWEAKQASRERTVARRMAHAVGFEGGLVVMLVPVLAWYLGISLWEAFVLDLGLLIFFMFYTYAFNLAFDKIFGLPASAQTAVQG